MNRPVRLARSTTTDAAVGLVEIGIIANVIEMNFVANQPTDGPKRDA